MNRRTFIKRAVMLPVVGAMLAARTGAAADSPGELEGPAQLITIKGADYSHSVLFPPSMDGMEGPKQRIPDHTHSIMVNWETVNVNPAYELPSVCFEGLRRQGYAS